MKTRNYTYLTVFMLSVALFAWTESGLAAISNTKHNLSVTGGGTYKATSETQLCVFCHTPHNTSPAAPLWNHQLSAISYTPYSSSTLVAGPGQPSGTSKLCLSCHDGTVALGGVQNLPLAHQATGVISGLEAFLSGVANLSTDLRNDHPVSFTYDEALVAKNTELVSPATLATKFKPDSTGQLQCTNCHDPHSDTYQKFLLTDFTDTSGYGSPLCRTCHNKAFWGTVANMSHREQTKPWNGSGVNPWHVPGHNLANDAANSTNKANGCESCHQPHNAASNNRILKQDGEANVCLVCHNGSVATNWNIDSIFARTYTHPVKDASRSGRHNPKRQIDGTVREDPNDLNNRHAICQDCHNPHAVSAGVSPVVSPSTTTTNLASKVVKGVWGVLPTWPANFTAVSGYTETNDVQYQYQLCLKCHSSYAYGSLPPASLEPGNIAGGIDTDQAKEFNPNNKSYHPVVQAGNNAFLATAPATAWVNGMSKTSVISCTDCHSDTEPGISGSKGPHGTNYWPILFGSWWPMNNAKTTPVPTDLICYKCHNPATYGGTGSGPLINTTSTGFTGNGGCTICNDSVALGTNFVGNFCAGAGCASTGSKINLHNWHVGCRQFHCASCHSAVPHGWQRRAMLIYGTVAPDPVPYNGHSIGPAMGCNAPTTVYGIKSTTDVEIITSGAWTKANCHQGGANNC